MKVKYIQGMAGPSIVIRPGDVREVSKDEGKRLCDAGIATPVRQTKTEKATSV